MGAAEHGVDLALQQGVQQFGVVGFRRQNQVRVAFQQLFFGRVASLIADPLAGQGVRVPVDGQIALARENVLVAAERGVAEQEVRLPLLLVGRAQQTVDFLALGPLHDVFPDALLDVQVQAGEGVDAGEKVGLDAGDAAVGIVDDVGTPAPRRCPSRCADAPRSRRARHR
jgi:hypothetical protein